MGTGSAGVLERALAHFRGDLTVADAAARTGLSLHAAEEALRTLVVGHGGHLAATDKGELVYSFPNGVRRPRETRLVRRIARALTKVALGGIRLLLRAWVSVVLVGYALVFLGILLALTLRGGDDRDGGVGDGLATVMRVIAEALFWTFHPFSPMFLGTEPRWLHQQARRHKLPFYERVNQFVFGPRQVAADPRAQDRGMLDEIRRQKGRVAPGDVMRVTGFSREEAERQLLRLVVDHGGDIAVSEDGAILYTFVELRTTASAGPKPSPPSSPIWNRSVALGPLTGNSTGWNVLFTFINGFNLAASGLALSYGLTLDRLTEIVSRMTARDPELLMIPLPPTDGIPLVLGAIPFAFSLALFVLPLTRLLRRPRERTRVARENGWRAVLRHVLASEAPRSQLAYTPEELGAVWTAAAGRPARQRELQDAVRDMGGDVDLRADGTLVYKFDVIAREFQALLSERARAAEEEASPGKVVFSSADEGHGIREDARDPTRHPEERQAEGTKTGSHTPNTHDDARDGAGQDAQKTVRLLEEQRPPLEFMEELLAEASRRRK